MAEHYHFIGIGGIGMSGLARMLLSQGKEVSGSDLANSYVTEGLVKAGAKVYIGHDQSYVTPNSIVIYSTDIKKDNPELLKAQKLKLKMMHRSDLLFKLMESQKTLSIAGTHGKTTTTSLLAMVLTKAGLKPSFAVGGMVQEYQANAGWGEGEYFVAEADESDGTFLKYQTYGAIVTNIDLDHINYFGSEEKLIAAFAEFLRNVERKQLLFWCFDDTRLKALKPQGISYGFSPGADLQISNLVQDQWKIVFDIKWQGKIYPKIEVSLVGKHNALNAAAVFGLAILLGAKEELVREALKSFKGVKRRCEKKGDHHNILILDDYGHHPTEIKTTLEGIRKAIGKRRLIAVFQPHRFSRIKECLGTFGSIFDAADKTIMTDIYAAGETPIQGLTYKNVMDEVSIGYSACSYSPRADLLEKLKKELKAGDVVVTLGAGDITKLSTELAANIKEIVL